MTAWYITGLLSDTGPSPTSRIWTQSARWSASYRDETRNSQDCFHQLTEGEGSGDGGQVVIRIDETENDPFPDPAGRLLISEGPQDDDQQATRLQYPGTFTQTNQDCSQEPTQTVTLGASCAAIGFSGQDEMAPQGTDTLVLEGRRTVPDEVTLCGSAYTQGTVTWSLSRAENPPECSDGIDNDADGKTDYSGGIPEFQDPGCTSPDDNGEAEDLNTLLTVGVDVINEGLAPAGAPLPGFRFTMGGQLLAFLRDNESHTRLVTPGAVQVVQDVAPTSWRIRRIECNDTDSTGNALNRTASYLLAPGEAVTCTFVNTPDLWDPLVDTAVAQAAIARQYGGGTRGYFDQIVSIVCAAGLNQRASCDQMAPRYRQNQWAGDGYSPADENKKCAHHEAGCWVFNVFDSYLRIDENKAIQAAREIEESASEFVRLLCKAVMTFPADLGCWGLAKTTEAQAVYAGAIHFLRDLHPNFLEITEDVVRGANPQGPTAVRAAVAKIVSQHEDLLADAVGPGFDVNYASGGLTAFGREVGQATVPFAAVCEREGAIAVLKRSPGRRSAG